VFEWVAARAPRVRALIKEEVRLRAAACGGDELLSVT
jgi:hypothetical protein